MAFTLKKDQARTVDANDAPRGRGRAFYYSILLHAALIVVFVIGIDWKSSTVIAPASAPQVMNATAVDAKQVDDEVKKLKSAEAEKRKQEELRQADAARKVQEEERKLEKLKQEQADAKRQKESENKRLDEERKQLESERELAAKAKAKAEQEKKQAEAAAKRAAEEKAAAEAKAKTAEAERKKRAEEAAKQQAADDKRKAEELRKLEAAKAEAALQAAMAQEEAEQAAAAQASADATELQRYLARIQAKVQGGFVYPLGLPAGLKCTLLVRVIPGGDVVDASVVSSSGNPVFDKQAENAVRRASPLPLPDEPRLAQQMREFKIIFEPES